MRLIDLVKALPDKDWYWSNLTKNPNITTQDIMDNLHLNWDNNTLMKNPNFTIENAKNYMNLNPEVYKLYQIILIYNSHITIEEALKLCENETTMTTCATVFVDMLSHRTDITFEDIMHFVVQSTKRYVIDWTTLSGCRNITIADIIKYRDSWNWSLLCRYANICVDDVDCKSRFTLELRISRRKFTYDNGTNVEISRISV
jgi:hypothetical protein